MEELKVRFRPEFLNRIDEFVTFNSLSRELLKKIVSLELKKVESRLNDRKVGFEISEAAMSWLATKGYDVTFGVRPLKRTIQREVETPVAKLLLAGHTTNDTIKIDIPDVQTLLKQNLPKPDHLQITVERSHTASTLSDEK